MSLAPLRGWSSAARSLRVGFLFLRPACGRREPGVLLEQAAAECQEAVSWGVTSFKAPNQKAEPAGCPKRRVKSRRIVAKCLRRTDLERTKEDQALASWAWA